MTRSFLFSRVKNADYSSGARLKQAKTASLPVQDQCIRFITHFFPPDFAASGQFIAEIAQSLSQDGVKVSVFTSQPAYAYNELRVHAPRTESRDNLFIWRSRLVRFWSSRLRGKTVQGLLFCFRCFLFFLRPRNRRDLFVVTTAPPFLPVLAWIIHKLFGIRYVCIIYDLYPDVANQLGISPGNHFISRLWRRLNYRTWSAAEALIVLNESMRDRILTYAPHTLSKIHILHNWADHERIKPIPKKINPFVAEHQLEKSFTVLYSGNLGRCHDADTIFDTITILRDTPIQFVFIGAGANLEILKTKVQQANLHHRVMFMPYQDWQDIPYSLASCDVSLVSIAEGFEGLVVPSKLYSSLAVGRPVAAICEAHSYLVSILDQTNSGQTFRNGDALGLAQYLINLSESKTLASTQGRNARQLLLSSYTRERITKDYRRVLLDVLDAQATPVDTRDIEAAPVP